MEYQQILNLLNQSILQLQQFQSKEQEWLKVNLLNATKVNELYQQIQHLQEELEQEKQTNQKMKLTITELEAKLQEKEKNEKDLQDQLEKWKQADQLKIQSRTEKDTQTEQSQGFYENQNIWNAITSFLDGKDLICAGQVQKMSKCIISANNLKQIYQQFVIQEIQPQKQIQESPSAIAQQSEQMRPLIEKYLCSTNVQTGVQLSKILKKCLEKLNNYNKFAKVITSQKQEAQQDQAFTYTVNDLIQIFQKAAIFFAKDPSRMGELINFINTSLAEFIVIASLTLLEMSEMESIIQFVKGKLIKLKSQITQLEKVLDDTKSQLANETKAKDYLTSRVHELDRELTSFKLEHRKMKELTKDTLNKLAFLQETRDEKEQEQKNKKQVLINEVLKLREQKKQVEDKIGSMEIAFSYLQVFFKEFNPDL